MDIVVLKQGFHRRR